MTSISTIVRAALLALSLGLLFGCQQSDPIRLGFLGGLTGHYSVLGSATRNGVILAVEESNASAGNNARAVELLIRDDKQNPQEARRAVAELLTLDVDVIIGPATSAMAIGVVDLVNNHEILMVAPSVTTDDLSGLDDYFLRITPATSYSASCLGMYLHSEMGYRKFAAIYDERNNSFSESWLSDFVRQFEDSGVDSVKTVSFSSGNIENLVGVAARALDFEPEMIVFITTSLDAAVLAKEVRSAAPQVQIAFAETERLIELAGRYAEGAFVPKVFVPTIADLDYRKFHESYVARFNQNPGTAGLQGYDTAVLVIRALREKPAGIHPKTQNLQASPFDAVQGPIVLDSFGDAINPTYITRVENGEYKVQDFQCVAT